MCCRLLYPVTSIFSFGAIQFNFVLTVSKNDISNGAKKGAALIIVLWIILILSLVATGLSFMMRAEVKLTSYRRAREKAFYLAESGIEIARAFLVEDIKPENNQSCDFLAEKWRSNPERYEDVSLGEGVYRLTVTDEESRLNVNTADEESLRKLFYLIKVEKECADELVDAILDWIDENDLHRLNGAEDDYYLGLDKPYRCKDAPLDTLEELLLVKGVTKEIFFGEAGKEDEEPIPGLVEILTANSSGRLNVNTASKIVLQTLPFIDEGLAQGIIDYRSGSDGIEGTEDDSPFISVAELSDVPGITSEVIKEIEKYADINSYHFRIESEGEVRGVKTKITLILKREGNSLKSLYWKEE